MSDKFEREIAEVVASWKLDLTCDKAPHCHGEAFLSCEDCTDKLTSKITALLDAQAKDEGWYVEERVLYPENDVLEGCLSHVNKIPATHQQVMKGQATKGEG